MPSFGSVMLGAKLGSSWLLKKQNPVNKAFALQDQGKNVSNISQNITSNMLNAQKDNQYHQKLSAEDSAETEKTKKRNYLKYVPAMAGAVLLTSAAASAIKSGDITKPFQDFRDGVKRVPAAFVNKFSETPIGKGVVKGARKGVKASKNAAKPKVNRSPMAEAGLGIVKGTAQFVPFLAGSAYLDYKAKKAKSEDEKERREMLSDVYNSAHPKASIAKTVGGASINVAKAVAADRKEKRENAERQ